MRDCKLTPERTIECLDEFLTEEEKLDIMQRCEEEFDLPESLDSDLSDFYKDMNLEPIDLITFISRWSRSRVKEFCLTYGKIQATEK